MSDKKDTSFNLKEFKRLLTTGMENKRLFYIVMVISLLLAILSSLRPILVGNAIDNYVIPKQYELLVQLSLILGGFLIGEVILQYFFILLSNVIAQSVIEKLRVRLFDKIIHYKLNFFNRTPNGTLVTRSVSDIETVSQVFTDGILVVLGDLLGLVFILTAMFYKNWKLALIVVFVLPVMVFVTNIFQKAIKKTFTAERAQTAKFNSFVQEQLSGMNIVQLFNRQEAEYKKFKSINEQLRDAYLSTVFYFSLLFPVVELVQALALGLVILFGGLSALEYGDVTSGEIIAFILFIPMMVRPIRQMAERFNNLQRGLVSSERVFSMIDLDETLLNTGTVKKEFIKGKIEFKNVFFGYTADEPVLKDVSFSAEPGETIALVGSTGAGKSTIINLLSRFYDIQSGQILIDGIDVREYELYNLRSHIAVVLQDVFLFNASIFENITLNDSSITYEEVQKAAEAIEIDDFIDQLPNQYNFQVSERGGTLSVGQRQLISFMRAYLYEPSILVLDEATSSIDNQSEKLIQKATEKITKNRTSIVIAHRLATIKNADKILVMDKGRISESGTHNELMHKNGQYRDLYEAQFSKQKS